MTSDEFCVEAHKVHKLAFAFHASRITHHVILQNPDHLQPDRIRLRIKLEAHPELAHDAHRGRVIIGGRCDDLAQAKLVEGVFDQSACCLRGVAMLPVAWRDRPEQADGRHK